MATPDKIKPHKCLIGPFEEYRVVVEGRRIPLLTASPESETQTLLILDGRLSIVIGNRDLEQVAWLVANALALGQGYSHMGATAKGYPFAPTCSVIEAPLTGEGG